MTQEVLVSIDLAGATHRVGTLWPRERGGRQSATFSYAPEWTGNPFRFAIEPALVLGPGPHHTTGPAALFGSLCDSAPDRWGRALMRRAEVRLARAEERSPRTLLEIDYLLRVHDFSRLGALRFSLRDGGPYLAAGGGATVPPLVGLPRLLAASERAIQEQETDEDLQILLAPGSSLGGARPKASVLDAAGRLSIAKFPSPTDSWPVVMWEAVAASLAAKAGIAVPRWSLEAVGGKPVLLLQRFDRHNGARVPFLSAMSMLGAQDHESGCYLEMVDALRRWGAAPQEDIRALFRRIVFNVLISNTDDHLRNHGFLFQQPDGWRLSPAYDMNPTPVDVKPRVLSTEISVGDATASLDLAFSVASYFGIDSAEARGIAREVGRSVAGWRQAAAHVGIGQREMDRMATAFEHEELKRALTSTSVAFPGTVRK